MKKTAYLGIPGSYSHSAAVEYFGDRAEYVGAKNFRDIFRMVEAGDVDYGLIPVENSLAGSVYDNYDLLYEHEVTVVGEHFLKVELHLLATHSSMPTEKRLKSLKKVVSHYKALEQCDAFLREHPAMKAEAISDTAGSAKFVADQADPLMAAIASETCAQLYGLDILTRDIQDNKHNYTRFLVIAKQPNGLKDTNKCSIIFTVLHKPGSLVSALRQFSDNEVNLIKIESRPIHGKPFEYIFYVDIGWNAALASKIESIIGGFRAETQDSKILGYYQSGGIEQNL
jgi:chorismate mutase/prephenate dehydratase